MSLKEKEAKKGKQVAWDRLVEGVECMFVRLNAEEVTACHRHDRAVIG